MVLCSIKVAWCACMCHKEPSPCCTLVWVLGLARTANVSPLPELFGVTALTETLQVV